MLRARAPVVVTGTGVVCAVAKSCDELTEALDHGRSGIERVQRFDTGSFTVHLGAEVKAWGEPGGPATATLEERLCLAYAESAAREALEQAALDPSRADPSRIAVVFGTNLGDIDGPVHGLAVELASRLGIAGPRLTVCTACSSSTGAIGLARELLLTGAVDAVLAGGADVLTERVFSGFHALGVLSPSPCAPFSTPFGTTLGEGAGFVVLERPDHAGRRSAPSVATVSGYGLAGDGHHETSPDPRGGGVERAIRFAIDDAGLGSSDIGYVNAHGSGTEANDPSEWRGIQKGLGRSDGLPVSSTKGALGHAQGAAGALEAIVTILMMRRGLAPPTLNFTVPRPFAPEEPLPGPSPHAKRYRHAICVNSGFGGANAAVVLSAPEPAPANPSVQHPFVPVAVAGLGVVSSAGLGLDPWLQAPAGRRDGRVPRFSLEEVDPRLDPHGLDPSSRFLTAAASMALTDAGVRLTRRNRSGAGLVVGATRTSPESLSAFDRSIQERGLANVSAPAFARIVLNASSGTCSTLLGLHGPLTALTVGSGTGLAAIVVAARLLQTPSNISLMLAGGVDELAANEEGSMGVGEGAACVALAPLPARDPGHDGSCPRITGWGMAGPHQLGVAVAMAMAATPGGDVGVDATFDERQFSGSASGAWALPSALAFVRAAHAVRSGTIARALVTSDLGDSVSMALLLDR